jgi:hypothetical protein
MTLVLPLLNLTHALSIGYLPALPPLPPLSIHVPTLELILMTLYCRLWIWHRPRICLQA